MHGTPNYGEAPYNDAHGVRVTKRYDCYEGETVGECAARIVQDRVSSFYKWLTLVGFAQAAIAALTLYFLIRQNGLMTTQAEIMGRQLKLSETQHFAMHRPQLTIRHVWVDDSFGRFVGQPGITLVDGQPVAGHIIVVNTGMSDAKIFMGEYRIVFRQSEELPPGCYEEAAAAESLGELKSLDFGSRRDRIFPPGHSYAARIEGLVRLGAQQPGVTHLRQFADGKWKIFVFGQIIYEDMKGRKRFVGFCRRSDMKTGFRAVDDPDYEFQD